MSIKKAYKELHTKLTANAGKMLSPELMAELNKIMSSKVGGGGGSTSILKDAKDKPVAIKCYYFKRWMPLVGDKAVEFTKKASSASGYGSMTKEGTKNWNAQYNAFKKAKDGMLAKVVSKEIKPENVEAELKKLEEARAKVKPTTDGFKTEAEVKKYLETQKVVF